MKEPSKALEQGMANVLLELQSRVLWLAAHAPPMPLELVGEHAIVRDAREVPEPRSTTQLERELAREAALWALAWSRAVIEALPKQNVELNARVGVSLWSDEAPRK